MNIEELKTDDDVIENLSSIGNDDLKILLEFYIHRLEVITEVLDKTAINVIIDEIFSTSHTMSVFGKMNDIPRVKKLSYETLCNCLADQIDDTSSVCTKILDKLYDRGIHDTVIDDIDAARRIEIVTGLARLAKEKYDRLLGGISLRRNIEKLKKEKKEP